MPRLHRIDILHNSRCKEYHTQSLNSVFAIGGSPFGNEKNKKEARPGWIKEQDGALIVFFFFLLHGRNYCRGQALRRHAHTGEENINKKNVWRSLLQTSQCPLDPFPLLTWFYRDHHHGGNSQKTSRESRGLLCAAASFIFFCFSHPHRKYGEWEKNTKTTTLNTQHFRVLLSASTRPQPGPNPFPTAQSCHMQTILTS